MDRAMMELSALGSLRQRMKAKGVSFESIGVIEPRLIRGDISDLGMWPPNARIFLVNCPSWPSSLKSALARNLIEHGTRLKRSIFVVITQPTALTELEDLAPTGVFHQLVAC